MKLHFENSQGKQLDIVLTRDGISARIPGLADEIYYQIYNAKPEVGTSKDLAVELSNYDSQEPVKCEY